MASEAPAQSPPLAHDVAIRALVLKSVVMLAVAVSQRRDMQEADFVTIRDGCLRPLMPHVDAMGIEDGAFLIEEDAARQEAEYPAALGRIEHLQVMAWALGHLDALPAYDQLASIDLIKLPAFQQPNYLPLAELRPVEEIEHVGKVAELWYWRAQMHAAIRDGVETPRSPEVDELGVRTYADYARWLAETRGAEGILPLAIGGDFSAFGKPYRDLTEQEYGLVSTVTYHRHYSFTWLRGLAPMNDWDHTARNL